MKPVKVQGDAGPDRAAAGTDGMDGAKGSSGIYLQWVGVRRAVAEVRRKRGRFWQC